METKTWQNTVNYKRNFIVMLTMTIGSILRVVFGVGSWSNQLWQHKNLINWEANQPEKLPLNEIQGFYFFEELNRGAIKKEK